MRTVLGHEVLVAEHIDLKGIITDAVLKGNLSTNGLVLRAYLEEQRQLKEQKGPLKSTHIFERTNNYNFGLVSLYKDGEGIVQQHLVSITKEGGIMSYHITRGDKVGKRLFKYNGVLTKGDTTYQGVSREDGVAEVLLGERRISQQPH